VDPDITDIKPETVQARPTAPVLARSSIPLIGSIAIYGLIAAALNTTLSLFLANAVHAATFLIGLFFTARAAAGIGIGLVTGWLSDRMPDRRAMLAVTGLSGAIGALCLSLSHDYALLLVGCVVFTSLGQGTFGQLFGYADESAAERGQDVTYSTSVLRSVFSAAYVVGPPVGLFVMAKYGFRPLYLGVAGFSLASAAVGRWGLRKIAPRVAVAAPRRSRERRRVGWAIRGAALPAPTWLLLGVVLVLGVVNQMYNIDISLRVTKDLGLSPELVGWMLGLTAGLEIPVMIAVGRVAVPVGRGRLTGLSAILAAVSFCLLGLASSPAELLVLAALNGVWQGVALSIPMVMVQDEAPGGAGTSSSLYGATSAAAGMVAGVAAGVTSAAVGYGGVLWVCAGLSAVAALLVLARRMVNSPKGTSTRVTNN
jgi:SET family sugar efflux transporter-like MFS transporter